MTHDPIDLALVAQLDLEAEMIGRGKERFRSNVKKSLDRNQGADTGARAQLTRLAVEPVTKAIRDYLAVALKGRAGRNHIAAPHMAPLEPEVLSFLTVKALFNIDEKTNTQMFLANRIGSWVNDEVRLREFEDKHKGLLRHVNERLQGRTANLRFRRESLILAMAKTHDLEVTAWPLRSRHAVGMTLLQLAIGATPYWEYDTLYLGKHEKKKVVRLTSETLALIDKQNERLAELFPEYLPTIVPPKEWTRPDSGGYFTPFARQLNLVKTQFRSRSREVAAALSPEATPVVFEAVNALQKTPWRVNKRVLEVLREAWEQDLRIGDMPGVEDDPVMAYPQDATEAELVAWRREARNTHNQNATRRTKRLQYIKLLQLGSRFSDAECFYFPHNLDFRGRAYAIPAIMNPQSFDAAKGILEFAEGKPLGSQQAVVWLAIHGANTFGFDKASLAERVEWVQERTYDIVHCAVNPFEHTWWTEADKPFQFLAFCFEWHGYTVKRLDHVTHLPVALDGSCNGIQHFSAMLRDPVGGKAVNLLPGDKPQDIYAAVADVVNRRLFEVQEPMADRLLDWGKVDRKITKRPVMVLPYGGTRISCRDYVKDAMKEKGADLHFGQDFGEAVEYLTGVVWDSIGEVVVGARTAMDWLKKVTSVVSKAKQPLRWTTPAGIRVVQDYRELSSQRIETHVAGSMVRYSVNEETPKLDARKQSTGVSPNFVHSLDASALMLTVVDAKSVEGITDFAMVHDSYGTLAPDVPALNAALRRVFVIMYEHYDVLADFLRDVTRALPEKAIADLPPLPGRGNLDIQEVLSSDFFFC